MTNSQTSGDIFFFSFSLLFFCFWFQKKTKKNVEDLMVGAVPWGRPSEFHFRFALNENEMKKKRPPVVDPAAVFLLFCFFRFVFFPQKTKRKTSDDGYFFFYILAISHWSGAAPTTGGDANGSDVTAESVARSESASPRADGRPQGRKRRPAVSGEPPPSTTSRLCVCVCVCR